MGSRFIAILGVCATMASAQYKLSLVGMKQYPTRPSTCASSQTLWPATFGTTDVWGYVDADGDEYAIVTGLKEVIVVKLPEMTEVGRVTAPTGGTNCYPYQRVTRTYKKHLYVTSDGRGTNEGLMIIDLKGLDEPVRTIKFIKAYAPSNDKISSHTFDIDTVQGYAYITSQAYDGFRIVDIRDPQNPKEVTEIKTGSIHDNMIVPGKNLLYVATGDNGYSIYDVTNKSNPVRKARFSKSTIGYSHNIWPTEDGRYAFTTDETSNSPVLAWDLDKANNYAAPKAVGQWLGASRMAHNVMVIGDLCFVPHYAYGVAVLDIKDPTKPVEVAHYDTYPSDDNPGFHGVFGVWLSPKGLVVTGNMDTGTLHVLKFESPSLVRPRAERGRTPGLGRILALSGSGRFLRGHPGLSVADASGRAAAVGGNFSTSLSDGSYFVVPQAEARR